MFGLFKKKSKESVLYDKLKSYFLKSVANISQEVEYKTLETLFVTNGLAKLRNDFIKNSIEISIEYKLDKKTVLRLIEEAYQSTLNELK